VTEQQTPNAWLPEITQALRDSFDRFVPLRRHAPEDFSDTVVHVHEVADVTPPRSGLPQVVSSRATIV
jgi:hypothetical protein